MNCWNWVENSWQKKETNVISYSGAPWKTFIFNFCQRHSEFLYSCLHFVGTKRSNGKWFHVFPSPTKMSFLSFLFFWSFDRDTREMLIVTSILTESVFKWSKDPANPFHHPYRLSSCVASFADERTCVHMHNLTASSKSLFRHQINDCWCIRDARDAVWWKKIYFFKFKLEYQPFSF